MKRIDGAERSSGSGCRETDELTADPVWRHPDQMNNIMILVIEKERW